MKSINTFKEELKLRIISETISDIEECFVRQEHGEPFTYCLHCEIISSTNEWDNAKFGRPIAGIQFYGACPNCKTGALDGVPVSES
jgi:hypothetical protein